MKKQTFFTCSICSNTFEGGRTRKICIECNKIPRYCTCGCGTQLKSIYNNSKFAKGHNTRFEPYEVKRARGLKGKIASLKYDRAREFICRQCGKISQGDLTRKTCIKCQSEISECACGCGTKILSNSRGYGRPVKYTTGHYTRTLSFEEHQRRNRKRLAKRSYTEEHNKANSERMKKAYKEGKLNHLLGTQKSSKVELSLKPYVEPLGYIHTLDKKYYIGKSTDRVRIPDYVNSKERKIIEVFGTYWHRDRILPEGQKHKTPQEVINWYKKYGWDCVVVWENEVPEVIEQLILEAANLGGF